MVGTFRAVEVPTAPVSVRSVTRAMALLSGLRPEGRTLTAMAGVAGISLSTASRLLGTMRQLGFVDQREDGSWVAGPELASLLYRLDQWSAIRPATAIATRALRDELDETSAFFVISGRDRLCIEAAESGRMVRRSCPPGLRAPFHLGAAGKVLLAFGDTDELLATIPSDGGQYQLVSGLTRPIDELRAECDQIRRDGHAFSRQESTLESWAVAVPFYVFGQFAGALCVAIPMTRDDPSYHQEVITKVKEAAAV